jgi:hypothetical protein
MIEKPAHQCHIDELVAIFEPGFLQKLLRALNVVPLGLQVPGHAEELVGQQLSGGDGGALHHALDDGLAVDRLGDCHPNALVAQRVLDRRSVLRGDVGRSFPEVIHVEIDHAVGHGLGDAHPAVLGELGDVGGRYILDDVDIACQDGDKRESTLGD